MVGSKSFSSFKVTLSLGGMSGVADVKESLVLRALSWMSIAAMVYLLIAAVALIGGGFKQATAGHAEDLFRFATNPILGLAVGIVVTASVQSSSTVTSIIVGLVAGGVPVTIAIPMIMGANIGTSVTNTLVSLGYIGNREEFRRAFAAATVLDMFNLIAVLIFFPLEIWFHPLEKLSVASAQMLIGETSIDMAGVNFVPILVAPVVGSVRAITSNLPSTISGATQIVLGIILIFGSILFLGKLLKQLMVGKAKELLQAALGRGPMAGIASGSLITILFQSSSTTTSLIVPLAGTGILSLAVIYPFTLGANIGTCVTALIAATGVTGSESLPALEIALVHLYFNALGVTIIFGIPFLRPLPILGAQILATFAEKKRAWAFAYIIVFFFVIPLLALGISLTFLS